MNKCYVINVCYKCYVINAMLGINVSYKCYISMELIGTDVDKTKSSKECNISYYW